MFFWVKKKAIRCKRKTMVNALLRAGASLDADAVDLIIEFLPALEKVCCAKKKECHTDIYLIVHVHSLIIFQCLYVAVKTNGCLPHRQLLTYSRFSKIV